MKIKKDYIIACPNPELWKFISNIDKFSKCVPNVESFTKLNNDKYTVVVNPEFSFLSGKLELNWTILELKKNQGKIKIIGKVIGGGYTLISNLKCLPKDKITKLIWTAEIQVSGLLKAVPESIIEGAATSISDKIFLCVSNKVGLGK